MKVNKIINIMTAIVIFSATVTVSDNLFAKKSSSTTTTSEKTVTEDTHDKVDTDVKKTVTTVKTETHKVVSAIKAKKAAKKAAKVTTAQQPSIATATSTINNNFNTWSGGSKTLTPTQLVTDLKNPDITNRQDAALLGAVGDRVNSLSIWDPSSLSTINQKLEKDGFKDPFPNSSYPNGATASYKTATLTLTPVAGTKPVQYTVSVSFTQAQLINQLNATNSKLYSNYTRSLANLNASYTNNGKPELGYSHKDPLSTTNTHLLQGPVGDCYFVSAVNAILQSDPKRLEEMIIRVPGKSNWFIVKFPGREVPILVKLTPAEVALSSEVQGGGVWLAVLSNAEAQTRASDAGSKSADKSTREEGTVAMLHGGTEVQTFALITGKKYQAMGIKSTDTSDIGNGLQTLATNAKQIPNYPGYYVIKPPVGICTSGHALLIVGYNPTTQQLLILNPWGTTDYYNPPSGSSSATQPSTTPASGNWFSMTNGEFEISLSQLTSNDFVQLTIPESVATDFNQTAGQSTTK